MANMDIDFSRRNKKPRLLTDSERDKLDEFVDSIHYSSRYAARGPATALFANILSSSSYNDDDFEYRHVQLPKQMLKAIPKDYFDGARGTLKLLWEDEWRGLGITQVRQRSWTVHVKCAANETVQSLGWEHYEVHEPEPHILLFK